MEVLEIICGMILLIITGFFAFMSNHCLEEHKQGKQIALPWEKE
tara:strand:- start:937 stop:1068 length:132 start_codon:yes stop_codon:yes gene_type:complete